MKTDRRVKKRFHLVWSNFLTLAGLALLVSAQAFAQGSGYSSGKFGLSGGNNTWPGGVATSHNGIPPVSLSTTCAGTVTPPSSFGSYTLTVTGAGCVIAFPTSVVAGDYADFMITEGASNSASFAAGYNGWFNGGAPFVGTVGTVNYVTCEFTGLSSPAPATVCGPPGLQAGLVLTPVGWTLVAHKIAGAVDNPTTVAVDTTSLGVNFIVVSCSGNYPAGVTPTDSTGANTWSQAGTTHVDNANNVTTRLYYVYAPTTSASQTFRCPGTGVFTTITMAAFVRSPGGTPAIDQIGGSGSVGNVTSLATGSISPGFANELIITSSVIDVATGTLTVNSPFTVSDAQLVSAGNYEGGGMAYSIQTAATPANATWSFNSTPAATVIASFR